MKAYKFVLFSLLTLIWAQSSWADDENRLLFSHRDVLEISVAPQSAAKYFRVPRTVVAGWRAGKEKSSAQITLSIRSVLVKNLVLLSHGDIALTIVPQYYEHPLFEKAKASEVTRILVVSNQRAWNHFLADIFAPTELKEYLRSALGARIEPRCEDLLI